MSHSPFLMAVYTVTYIVPLDPPRGAVLACSPAQPHLALRAHHPQRTHSAPNPDRSRKIDAPSKKDAAEIPSSLRPREATPYLPNPCVRPLPRATAASPNTHPH